MKKYKIQYISKDIYQVISIDEEADEVFLEVLFKGALHLCHGYIALLYEN